MGLAQKVSQSLFKRTSTFALTIFAAAFFFERTVDLGVEATFDKINEGRLWKHIKDKYEQ